MSRKAAYMVRFYDEDGERLAGGRVWDVKLTDHHEVVPVDDYFEVWVDPLYNWRPKDLFFERSEVTGVGTSKRWMAVPTTDFDTFEVEPVFPKDDQKE